MSKASTYVHLVLVSVQLGFSGWHILASVSLGQGVEPLALSMYREVFATALMLALAYRLDGFVHMQPDHFNRILLAGAFCFGNVVGTVVALKYTSPTNYALMQPSIPVFATIMSVVLGMEKATKYTALGTALSVGGAITVEMWKQSAASSSSAAADSASSVGFFLVVMQCICMAGLIVTLKPLSSVYPTTAVTAWYYAVASVLTIFACLAAGLPTEAYALTGKPMPWIALAYVTVVATFYCYNAYSWALARAPPGMVTMYSTLQPVGTAFLSVLFLEKPISMGQVAGGVLVVAGLMVSIYEKTYAHGKHVDPSSDRPHHDSDEEQELMEKKRLLSPRQNVTLYDRTPTHEP